MTNTSPDKSVAGKILAGKIAVVTGANGGLGRHVTQALLDAGATVVGISQKIQQADFDSSSFMALTADITSATGAQKIIDDTIAHFARLDVLVHTVGGFAGGTPVHEIDDATFQKMFDLNLNSTLYLLRSAIPAMRKTRNGRVIAIGSRAAVDPGANVGAYSSSKAAMVSLVRTVAQENKDVGITANVILPGTIDTAANRKDMPKADVGKWVQPASIASLIVWLASEAGKDVNGAMIPVYGADV